MPLSDLAAVKVVISGRVQGVGFRYFALQKAQALSLKGWVRNLPSGEVEAYGEGPRQSLMDWTDSLQVGPALAAVEKCHLAWAEPQSQFPSFEIRS